MRPTRNTITLLATLLGVALGVGGVTTVVLYRAGVRQTGELLQGFVRSQALLVETVVDLDPGTRGVQRSDLSAVLTVLESHPERFVGFGRTGEFQLARMGRDGVEFLLLHRIGERVQPVVVPTGSGRAVPMQRALAGEAGILIAPDYRGVEVLAAHEPMPGLGLGLVAKVDMVEVRAPYLRAGGIAGGTAAVLILLGLVATRRVASRLERARDESFDMMKALLDGSPIMYATLSPEGTATYVNRAFERVFGWSAEEWTATSRLPDMYPDPEEYARVMEFVERGEGVWRRFSAHDRHGGLVETECMSIALPDGSRVVMKRDVTQEQSHADQARRGQALLERAEQIARLGSWSHDLVTGEVRWSPNLYRLVGRDPAGGPPLPDDHFAFLDEEDAEVLRSWRSRMLAGERGLTRLVRTNAARGPVRHLSVSVFVEDDERGQVTRLTATVWDQTEQVAAEKRIREQQEALVSESERFRQALEHIPAVIVIYDTDLRIRFINRATQALTGRDIGEFLGKRDDELHAPAVYERYMPALREALATGEPTEVRTWMDLPVGRRHLHIECVPLRGLDGNVREVMGITHDLTDEVEARRRLTEAAAFLEEEVRRRTSELVTANEELESFSYSVSHDLKAPLRAIDGFSSMLEDQHGGALSVEAQRILGVIRESVAHMGSLVDDLLEFSRLGRLEVSPGPVDTGELVRGLVAHARSSAPGRDITVHVGDLPAIRADLAMVRQVFQNLISNAIKFTAHRSEAVIEIECRTADAEHVFTVRDNGAGFDPAYVGRLFRVFERLHYPDEFPGTGVGLAIVKRVVEKHGGRVWAAGAVDQGATFSVTFPL